MPRALVVCCDDTHDTIGSNPTSVARVLEIVDASKRPTLVFYDQGQSDRAEPSKRTSIRQLVSTGLELGFARGLATRAQSAYAFLMDAWEPGDDVYLFGFSRGAYTVRVLAGWLHALGLLPVRNQHLITYSWKLYSTAGRPGTEHFERCRAFRRAYARPIDEDDKTRFPVRFVGVWDTVSAMGWLWDSKVLPYTTENPSIQTVRHAIALDERRSFYREHRLRPAAGQDFAESWFPGGHGDVGGTYPAHDSGIWRPPFRWMISEAEKAGLPVDQLHVERLLSESGSGPDWQQPIHNALKGWWWIAEIIPRLETAQRVWPRVVFGNPRTVKPGAVLNRTLIERIQLRADYRPPNLSSAVLYKMLASQQPIADAPYPGEEDSN